MIILKYTKNLRFQKGHNLLLNNLTFKFYNRSIHSNFKMYRVKYSIVNVNLPYTFVRRIQHIQVWHYGKWCPLNNY